MGILQTWLYFHWYPKDSWGLKLTVLTLLQVSGIFCSSVSILTAMNSVVETLQVSLLFASIYNALINNFGNIEALDEITWMDPLQIILGFLSAFIVQMYIFTVVMHIILLTYCQIFCILHISFESRKSNCCHCHCHFGVNPNCGRDKAILGSFSVLAINLKVIVCLQSSATVLCDIVITAALCIILHRKKGSIKSTNTALGKLMIFGINRGAFTSLGAALNLILFLAIPGTFYFFLGLTVSSKLYMNALLSTLNTRQYVSNSSYTSQNSDHPWQSINLGQRSAVRTGESEGVSTKVVNFDQASHTVSGKRNFTSDMI
ncbi:hypothetical protein BT96DRAFT_980603 [Gymnopus androsaceus JB14]|uniref:DUF6534 domain-containing protein n=1 Tax=Gymnopus androsaceus JB14 TaxID=1447944 RepID=A0A6A4GV35_9AGAR|nr:hypothetical protein BT96DRAFT_980603 [Gymnopus androsaceus JB14]